MHLVGILFPLLHFSHDQSSWSSPSFCSTKFQNSQNISELFFEVPRFQNYTKLCSNCSNAPAASLNLSPVCWWKDSFFFLLNTAFAMEILGFYFRCSSYNICHKPHQIFWIILPYTLKIDFHCYLIIWHYELQEFFLCNKSK